MSVDMDFYKSITRFRDFKDFERKKLGELTPVQSFISVNFIVYEWIKLNGEILPFNDENDPKVYLLSEKNLKILLKKCRLAIENYNCEVFFRKYGLYNWRDYVELFENALENVNKGYNIYLYYSE